MKKTCYFFGIAFLLVFTRCTKEEEPLTEWGQMAKARLEELSVTITDLAWLKVYNADESELFWSGVGTPETGSPVLMWTVMESFLGVEFQRFDLENNNWNISRIEIPYNDIIGIILQYVSFYENGFLTREANGLLIYMSNSFSPDGYVDGVAAMAPDPEDAEVLLQKEILSR